MSTQREVERRSTVPSAGEEATRAAATHLIVQLGMPAEISARIPGAGEALVRPALLDRVAARAWRDDGWPAAELIALRCAGQSGALLVEQGLAVGLVNAVLGLVIPPFAGPLSRIERGVLAGTLATLLVDRGLTPGIRLGAGAGASPGTGTLVIAFSVRLLGREGQAWLAASEEFLAGAWATRSPGRGTFSPSLELAATTVAGSELAGAGPGDKVVFDETAALSPDEAWPVRVSRDVRSVPAWWSTEGVVVAADSQAGEAATRPDRAAVVQRVRAAASPGGVQVTAGYACPTIDPAHPTPLVVRRDGPVVLLVDGRAWAYGAIAEIDGALAVTITRKLAD